MSIYTIDDEYKIKKSFGLIFIQTLIGLLYSTISDFLGFEINEGEFKVMSLEFIWKTSYMRKQLESKYLILMD